MFYLERIAKIWQPKASGTSSTVDITSQIAHDTALHIIDILREKEPHKTLTARNLIMREILDIERAVKVR